MGHAERTKWAMRGGADAVVRASLPAVATAAPMRKANGGSMRGEQSGPLGVQPRQYPGDGVEDTGYGKPHDER